MNFEQLQPAITRFVTALPAAIAIIVGAIILNFLIKRALKLVASRTRLKENDITPLGKVLGWLVFLGTIIVLLGVFGFDLAGMWAMITGVGAMVAIGFIAVWSVLSNWLCTLVILITRPFAIGDQVEFVGEETKGRVVDLNFIYTSLRADDGATLQVPNNLFFQRVLKRYHSSAPRPLADQLNRNAPADT